MDMYKLKWTTLQNEIFRFLCIKVGISLNQRGIARSLKVSPTSIAKSLGELEKGGLIKVQKDKESKRFSIQLNRDNSFVIGLKRADNLKQLYESGFVQFIYDNFPSGDVILFGSYSFGEDTIKSDIDIAIIGTKEKDTDLTKFDKLLERTIILNYYKSFHDIDKHLLNNILNGIILKGAIEL